LRCDILSFGMARAKTHQAKRIWVIKAGSSTLAEGGPLLIRSWMNDIAELQQSHRIQFVWVTSGAIASGRTRTGKSKSQKVPEKQALSAIGQPLLMNLYLTALQSLGLVGAQVLLTASDMADPERAHNLQSTLRTLLQWNCIPVLNENDATATEEIRFGDNDQLSAQVSRLVGAEKLILLTDVAGLFDRDPHRFSKAKLLSKIQGVSDKTLRLAGGTTSSVGTGGMRSKLLAAKIASESGIVTHLVEGMTPHILKQVALGNPVGTTVLPRRGRR
jgi:glutamate 5-kinase